MWFKNLRVYRFTQPCELTAEALERQLGDFAFVPCGSQDAMKQGFVAPLGKGHQAMVHVAGGNLLICMRRQDKLLPGGVVRELLEERCELREQEQGRQIRGKEKQQLKDEITQELLPRAFTRTSQLFAVICPRAGYLLVDASSVSKAEDLLSLVRKAAGSLPVIPVATRLPVEHTLSEWVAKNSAPATFEVGFEAELREPGEEGGIIRAKQQDLQAEEVLNHLAVGKQVTKLALTWREQVEFLLGDDWSLKRLKFAESLQDAHDDIDREDRAARFDADVTLMLDTLLNLLPELFDALGGVSEGQMA